MYDVAFQQWVLKQAFQSWDISSYLMLADKSRQATVEGLHQNFRVVEDESGRFSVDVEEGISQEDLGQKILTEVQVTDVADKIINGEAVAEDDKTDLQKKGFEEWVTIMAEHLADGEKYPVEIGENCKDCPFFVKPTELEGGQKSGGLECWSEAVDWTAEDFQKPHIFDLWSYRDTEERLGQGIFQIEDMDEDQYPATKESALSETQEWSTDQRQTIQILSAKGEIDGEIILDGLKSEIDDWTFPLHFIDFEVHIGSALPFHKGMRPYEPVAFQFSEHQMQQDFSVQHQTEWLMTDPHKFPNFDFVQTLKDCLSDDEGTIFMYSTFENTILGQIADQLEESEVNDADDLTHWIQTITRDGERQMVDLLELTKKYHYHPLMGGSLSLKDVLPAILQTSNYLEQKYSQPYQGKNFDGIRWHQTDGDGKVRDPYELLPPLGKDLPNYKKADEAIRMGSAAMMGYSRLQFGDLEEEERQVINDALLQYCELDTLAMVMLVEHWLAHIDMI